ncbi:MAG: glycosyltransferase family 2 protein [Desulfobacteraceae bacterium]|nr:glycosyltransferase family 2 protein [Desulfobacteraceae bacterium]
MADLDISFVIVNWNTRALLLQCVAAIYETVKSLSIEVIVVDNGSTDDSVQAVQNTFPQVRCIVNSENKGFGAANNQAFRVMRGRYALLLNTDATLKPRAAQSLFAFMESHPQTGMACGQLLNPDGSKQNSHATFPSLLGLAVNESLLKWLLPGKYPSKYRDYKEPLPIDSCVGACMIVRQSAMEEVGLFDERYFFFFEETDWARQFWQGGWQVHFVPQAQIIHAQGQSAGANALARKLFYYSRYQYLHKWHPSQFGVMKAVILLRLALNVVLNSAAVLLTAGLVQNSRFRCQRYWQLLTWHFSACPFPMARPAAAENKAHE